MSWIWSLFSNQIHFSVIIEINYRTSSSGSKDDPIRCKQIWMCCLCQLSFVLQRFVIVLLLFRSSLLVILITLALNIEVSLPVHEMIMNCQELLMKWSWNGHEIVMNGSWMVMKWSWNGAHLCSGHQRVDKRSAADKLTWKWNIYFKIQCPKDIIQKVSSKLHIFQNTMFDKNIS